MRYNIIFSYDGSLFNGYQKQPNKRTVQEELENVLKKINAGENVAISASGRTDSGVHAKGQSAHFNLNIKISTNKLKSALNSLLPPDIYVSEIRVVSCDFHARFSATEKEYIYILNEGKYDPLQRNYVYQYNNKLNINKMRKASKYLIGTHNFKSFTKCPNNYLDYERTIYSIKIKRKDNKIYFTLCGNGFMRYMVRNIVGNLIEVGIGNLNYKEIKTILEKQDRKCASKCAPACGLYLSKVEY